VGDHHESTGAEAINRQFLASIGVRTKCLDALVDQLHADFSEAAGGYRAYRYLPLRQRAIVSDQILGAAQATKTNLVEARVSEQNIGELLADGVPYGKQSVNEWERGVRTEMAFVGFFRAIGSCLDCLATVTVGVLRLPLPIRRVSYKKLLGLTEKVVASYPAWVELKAFIEKQSENPPGWLGWTLEMRHAYMHRARLMNILMPRKTEAPHIALPERVLGEIMRERLRFEPYFRRHPWLPDMQHLADPNSDDLTDAIITEPAVQTVRGVFESTNRLVEDLAERLLTVWIDPEFDIAPPGELWKIEPPVQGSFSGFAPSSLPDGLSALAVNPREKERIALASRLHQEKLPKDVARKEAENGASPR